METPNPARAAPRGPVPLPFRCPRCAAMQQVDLVAFSRAGSLTCAACKGRLTREQVSQALERARRAGAGGGAPAAAVAGP